MGREDYIRGGDIVLDKGFTINIYFSAKNGTTTFKLDILVENQGRISFTPRMSTDFKGNLLIVALVV